MLSSFIPILLFRILDGSFVFIVFDLLNLALGAGDDVAARYVRRFGFWIPCASWESLRHSDWDEAYISNLDYGVSNEDIKVFIPFVDYWNDKRDFFFVWFCWQWRCLQELFSEVGEMKRYGIHYDKSGRSKVAYEA